MTDIIGRVAEVIEEDMMNQSEGDCEQGMIQASLDAINFRQVADAVIAELGLKPADKLTPQDGTFYVTKVWKDA